MGVYQIGEVIKKTRESLGITQEELSVGICSVETLSRIENGKRAPSRSNFRALMERMGKSGEKYMPFVHSGNVETIVESVEINTLMAQDRHDEADKRLEIFRKKVDLNDNVNRQYVLRTQAMIDYRLGRIDVEAERVQLIEAFLCTVPEYREKKLPVGIYSRYEIIIFCNIAFEKEILQENKKTCKKLLLQAFFVAELNGNKYMMNHIKEHMRKMDYDIV